MSKRIPYIHQLDSLRAIAAFMVILVHFCNELNIADLDFGKYGVDIFFAISGYLITAILLRQKETYFSVWKKIGCFLTKRVLRLFPLYYAVIIFFSISALIGFYVGPTEPWIYYYTYTINIHFFNVGMPGTFINHFWTLAVEEQFYLIWPLIIFGVAYRYIKHIIVALIMGTLIFNYIDLPNARWLTIAHFDTLGGGALIAYLLNTQTKTALWLQRHIGTGAYPTFFSRSNPLISQPSSQEFIPPFSRTHPHILKYAHPLISPPTSQSAHPHIRTSANLFRPFTLLLIILFLIHLTYKYDYPFAKITLVAVMSIVLVIGCIYRFRGLPGRIMDSKTLIYLGQISYGLYVFHKPVPTYLRVFLHKLNFPEPNKYMMLTLSIGITLAISHLSYVYFEKRFIRMKTRFDL